MSGGGPPQDVADLLSALAPAPPPPPPAPDAPPPRAAPDDPNAPTWLERHGVPRNIAQVLSYGARGMAGAGDLMAAPGNWIARNVLDPTVGRLFGPIVDAINPPAPPTLSELVTGQQPAMTALEAAQNQPSLTGVARDIGLTDHASLAPRTNFERYLTQGAEGAGGALAMAPIMPGGPIAQIGRSLFAGAGSGAGGELGAQLWTAHPDAGRLIGGLIGGIPGSMAYSALERGAGALTNAGDVLQASRTAGVPIRMVGDASGDATMQALQNTAERTIGGAGRVQAAANQTLQDFQTSLGRAMDDLGTARTPQQAGQVAQDVAANWLTDWRSAARTAWNRVTNILPDNTPIDLTRTRAAINQLGQRMSDVPDVAAAMQGDQFSRLRDAINASPQQWRSQSVSTLRSLVGELIDSSNLGGNIPQAELRQLYGALSDDIRGAVAMRPGGLQAWQTANAITRGGHDVVDRIINNLIERTPSGANAIRPENAFQWITQNITQRGGGSRLADVQRLMESQQPGSFGNIGSAVLEPASTAMANTRSPTSLLTLLGNRTASLSPEARDVLFGAGGPTRARLEALSTLADRMTATARLGNPSGTAGVGNNIAWLNAMGRLMGNIGGYALGDTTAGLGGAVGEALAPPVMGNIVGRFATNPIMARLAAAPSSMSPTARTFVNPALTGASGVPVGGSLIQQQLLRAALSPGARALLLPGPSAGRSP
jgi:hypothetical protein